MDNKIYPNYDNYVDLKNDLPRAVNGTYVFKNSGWFFCCGDANGNQSLSTNIKLNGRMFTTSKTVTNSWASYGPGITKVKPGDVLSISDVSLQKWFYGYILVD
ncbi:MAG: hypothetical protein J1F17_04145 [Oscillospiraceae bacterium]|nr:hypothetical protein [Oscillospiraceae bacterium]